MSRQTIQSTYNPYQTSTPSIVAVLLFSIIMSLFQTAQAGSSSARKVNVVKVENGTFRQISRKGWVEQNKQGKRVFTFKETRRNSKSVYLYDASRKVNLQLNIRRKMVRYSDANNSTKRDLYRITSSSSKMSAYFEPKDIITN